MVIHQQLLIFLKHSFRHSLGNFNDDILLPLAPGLAKPCPDGFAAKDFQPAFAAPVIVKFMQQRAQSQRFEIRLAVRIRVIPAPGFVLQEGLFQQHFEFRQGLVFGLVEMLNKTGLQLPTGLRIMP